jgi:hypothetical protein
LTLKKEYVKPVVRLLEPSAAYAQTPALSVGVTAWTQQVFDWRLIFGPPFNPAANTMTMTLDLPGGSAPIVGSTYNGSTSITNIAEPGGWGSAWGILVGATVTSNTINNAAVAGPGGVVQWAYNFLPFWGIPPGAPPPWIGLAQCPTLNGLSITPTGYGTAVNGMASLGAFIPSPTPAQPGNRARVCLNADADAGVTVGGTAYPAQPLGSWCFEMQWS